MRYAIISDIHANPKALEKVLRDAREQCADKVVCLGDVVGYGPDPVAAVALCRESCGVTLMGNHDAAVAGVIATDGFIAFAREGVRRHRELLGAEDAAWLGAFRTWRCFLSLSAPTVPSTFRSGSST